MIADDANLVAGVFKSRRQADVALRDLHGIGLTDADLEVGAPAPGSYRIEYHESNVIGRGIKRGVLFGVPVGGLIAAGFFTAILPAETLATTIGMGLVIGGYWGIFFGGLTGMVLAMLKHREAVPRFAVQADSPEILIVAHAGDHFYDARDVMEHDGARYFLEDVPAMRSRQGSLAAAG
jgi:hypothetical protein